MRSRGLNGPKNGKFCRIDLGNAFPVEVLALGSELKNTVCAGRGRAAWISQPLDDLSKAADFRAFLESAANLRQHLNHAQVIVACDAHPNYTATRYAASTGRKVVRVQHHHAHALSCAADAGVDLPVIGLICDGTGYGTDGAIWGGELLLCEGSSFTRLAHLFCFAVPGGDAAARSPWRSALGATRAAFADHEMALGFLSGVDRAQRCLAVQQLQAGLNATSTSSLGRLFDAVAAITGVGLENVCEGHAAGTLERIGGDSVAGSYPYEFQRPRRGLDGRFDEPGILDWRPMLREIVGDAARGLEPGAVSSRFHGTLIDMFAEAAMWAAAATGVPRAVLSGGCFLNQILRNGLIARLTNAGLEVGTHHRVPTGDAGLSLGQAIIASHQAAAQSDASTPELANSAGVLQCV